MVSRLDESSVSTASADSPLKMFSVPPTQEDTIDSEWAEVLATQSVTEATHGDVVEFRVSPVGQAEGWNPSESFVKVEGYWQKTAKASMRDEGLEVEQVTTALGFPETGLFSRCSMALNNTVINQETTEYDTAEFVNALMTRPGRELSASENCCGWSFDELLEGPGCMSFEIDAADATSGTIDDLPGVAAAQGEHYIRFGVTNAQLRAANILPSSHLNNAAAGGANRDVPQIVGDLRAGMRVKIFAVGFDATVGGAGNAAAALSAFNAKSIGQEFVLQHSLSTTTAAGPYLRPAGNADADVTHFILQNVTIPVIRTLASGAGAGAVTQTAINLYAQSADIFIGGFAGAQLAVNKFRIVVLPDSLTMANMRQRRATLLPLGMNKGALERRQRYLAGGAFGGDNGDSAERYQRWSVAYQPFIGPGWKDCQYIPPGVLTTLRLTINDKSHMLRDYSKGGVASQNLTLKLTKATLFQKRRKYSPQLDLQLASQYAAGSVLKLNGKYMRQFTIRQDAGAQSFVVRSFLQGQKAEKYIVWVSPDSFQGPNVPQSKSHLDLNWEPGIDITEMYMVIGQKIYPARRLNIESQASVVDMSNDRNVQATAPHTAITSGNNRYNTYTRSSADLALPYWSYRSATADPSDPALTSKRWSSYPLWVFDTALTDDRGVVDPVQEGVSVELRISTSRPTTVAMKIGIQAINDAVIEVTGAGVVTSSMDS